MSKLRLLESRSSLLCQKNDDEWLQCSLIFDSIHEVAFQKLFLNSWRHSILEFNIWKYAKIWWLFISLKDEDSCVSSYFLWQCVNTKQMKEWNESIRLFFLKRARIPLCDCHMFLIEGHCGQYVITISAYFCPIHWDLLWLLDIHNAWVCLYELGPHHVCPCRNTSTNSIQLDFFYYYYCFYIFYYCVLYSSVSLINCHVENVLTLYKAFNTLIENISQVTWTV